MTPTRPLVPSGPAAVQFGAYAAVGDKDRSFEALERMAIDEPQRLGLTLLFPELTTLRGNPRFDALRRKLRLS